MAALINTPPAKTSLNRLQFRAFIISFLLPSFLLISLLFMIFINMSFEYHSREQKNNLEILSAHLVGNINSDLVMSLSYVFDSDVTYFYNFLNRTPFTKDLISYNQLLQPYNKTLNTYMTLLNKNIIGMGFIPHHNNSNKYFHIQKYHSLEIQENIDYEKTEWYEYLTKNDSDVFFTSKGLNTPKDSISLIRVAKNIDKKQILGFIFIDISMDFLYELLDGLSISESSGILLHSPTGEFLFSTNNMLSPASSLLNPGSQKIALNNDIFDVRTFTDSTSEFTFYYLSSRNDLYASFLPSLWVVILFYVLMAVIAYFVFLHLSRRISKSINPIIDVMNQYDAGNSNIRCETEKISVKEIATISNHLNNMITNTNSHIDNEYKLIISQKTAEFQALQAEVDPHFLYNTLNIFITLNRLEERSLLERTIIRLSNLFRYTCEHTKITTLSQEFSFLENYLHLQQLRYDDRLEFEIYLDNEITTTKLPKLLIQPLVENAIVHALEPSDLKTKICISAIPIRKVFGENIIVISVINSGLPYVVDNSNNKRTGLKNVIDRLSYFNNQAFFHISGGIDKPTKCHIVLPLHGGNENVDFIG